MTITSLLVDDEELSRAHLQKLLERENVAVLGVADNAEEAVVMAGELRPDVVFLDIEMPTTKGIDVAERLAGPDGATSIVFVTGFAEYALAAFDRGAVDYLLKPVMRSRLTQTIDRLRSRLSAEPTTSESLPGPLLAKGREIGDPPLRRLSIRDDYRIRLIRTDAVLMVESRQKTVRILTDDGEFRGQYTLKYLEERLDREKFMRVHESYIVNLDAVEELLFLGNHVYEARLSDKTRVPVGRHRFPELKKRLDA